MKFKYLLQCHQHCDFILCSECLHITGESCLYLGLMLLCKILGFLKVKREKQNEQRPVEEFLEVPKYPAVPVSGGSDRITPGWWLQLLGDSNLSHCKPLTVHLSQSAALSPSLHALLKRLTSLH